jgi:hypothetical protein
VSGRRAVPDWLLERLARGELPAAQAEALLAELEETGEGERLAALQASNVELLRRHPPEAVAAEVRRRAALARRSPRAAIWAGAALGAAGLAALLLVVRTAPPAGNPADPGESVTLKGLQPALRLYRKAATGPVPLASGARVKRGDTLQAAYIAGGRRYGVIASVDARGAVTLHLPEQAGRAAPLAGGGEQALGHAFELDESPGFERFLFVAADKPFATEDVARALTRGTPLPPAVATIEITLIKERP